jgi:hypothetical protein
VKDPSDFFHSAESLQAWRARLAVRYPGHNELKQMKTKREEQQGLNFYEQHVGLLSLVKTIRI